MTEYVRKSFTVGQRGTTEPAKCEHGMVRPKDGSCCFCGASKGEIEAAVQRKNMGPLERMARESPERLIDPQKVRRMRIGTREKPT